MKSCLMVCMPLCLAFMSAAQETADPADQSPPHITEFASVDDLKTLFNDDAEAPRLLVLLSPTCPKCIEGAEWIKKNVFEAYPDAALTAYVVWLPVLPMDKRERIPSEMLSDSRAQQFWDEERLLGTWLKTSSDCPSLDPVAWDAYYLFAKDTRWDAERLPAPVSCGTPIYLQTRAFERALKAVFGSAETE